jgi:hypothetical protein
MWNARVHLSQQLERALHVARVLRKYGQILETESPGSSGRRGATNVVGSAAVNRASASSSSASVSSELAPQQVASNPERRPRLLGEAHDRSVRRGRPGAALTCRQWPWHRERQLHRVQPLEHQVLEAEPGVDRWFRCSRSTCCPSDVNRCHNRLFRPVAIGAE